MGFLKSMGNKVASAFGSGQAQGRLETGKIANQLKKDFDVYLGKSGDQPTAGMVIAFLKSKGYPTTSAERLLKSQPAQEPAVQQPAAPAAAGPAAPAQPSQTDIAKRVKANVGKTAAATKGSNFGQQPEQPAQPAGSAISSFVKQQLGDNPITMKPAPQKAAPAAGAAQQPVARPQGGGKVAGQVSQTPNAMKKRQARAVKKRTTHPADDNPNIVLGTESYIPEGSELFRQTLHFHRILKEALSTKQIDAVFLAAAQDKARQDASGGGAKAAAPAGATTAAAAPGADALAGKTSGGGSSLPDQGAMAHIRAAADGWQGVDYLKGGDPRAKPAELKDPTGAIPANIMSQINSLDRTQRAALRKELSKA